MEKVRLLIILLAVPAVINGENDDKQMMNGNVAENENGRAEVDPRWKMQLLNRFQEVRQVNWPHRQFFGERPSLIEIPHHWHHQQPAGNRNEFREPFNNIEVLNQFNEIRQPNDFRQLPDVKPEIRPEISQPLKGISTSIIVPLVPVHVDPMGNTVRLPVTFQRQERQSNLVNERANLHQHMRFRNPHQTENDNRFEEQRNVENRQQNLRQVQVPVFVPQNLNQKLEENLVDKPFRAPLSVFPQQNLQRFNMRPNDQNKNVKFDAQEENENDDRESNNFRQAKEQSPNSMQSVNMINGPQQSPADAKSPNRQRPLGEQISPQDNARPDNNRLFPPRDLPNEPPRDLSNRPSSRPLDIPTKNRPQFAPGDALNGQPFPLSDPQNGPPFPPRNAQNLPFPSRNEPNIPPFPLRGAPNGPPFPLQEGPSSSLFPLRDTLIGSPFPQPSTFNEHPLRASENDNSFRFQEPPNGNFDRNQMPNHIRQFSNQNSEPMPNLNRQNFNQNQQNPNQNQPNFNQNQQNPNQNQQNFNQNQQNHNQNQQNHNQNQQNPNQNQQNPNQNQQNFDQNQQNPNENQQNPNQNLHRLNQNQQQPQMPFMNQQFANNQPPPQLSNQRQPHQLPFNDQRPPPEMMPNFPNQNRPFFNREPNFDRRPNEMRPDFNNAPINFHQFSKEPMPLPEVPNALTSMMPNDLGHRRPPFEFSQGPPRPPFTGPPQQFRPPQRPQMPPPKNMEVPKVFGDFPSEPKFDRSPWIPVTPLPKFPRKPIASSSREAFRVENPPTNSFSTTLPSVSTASGVGRNFEALPPTSTPTQPEQAAFQSTMMTPASTLMSVSTIAPPLIDKSPKISFKKTNRTKLINNRTLDEKFNRLRRLPEVLQSNENRPTEATTLFNEITPPTKFDQQPVNVIDSTPWTNEALTDVPIASSLAITEPMDYPSTTPSQEMSASLRQIGVEQLYRHWKNQFAQTKIGEQEPATTEAAFNVTSFPLPPRAFNGGVVNERLQALDLRPSDWSRRTSPLPEVTSFQTLQIQTPEAFAAEEPVNALDRRHPTGSTFTSTEPYPQLLPAESVATPNYVVSENYAASTTANLKKRGDIFTKKVLVRRRKIVRKKVPKDQEATVNQVEYSTPSSF